MRETVCDVHEIRTRFLRCALEMMEVVARFHLGYHYSRGSRRRGP